MTYRFFDGILLILTVKTIYVYIYKLIQFDNLIQKERGIHVRPQVIVFLHYYYAGANI